MNRWGRDLVAGHSIIGYAAIAMLLIARADLACASEFAAVETPMLGVHTLLTQADGLGTAQAVSTPIDTQSKGSSLLVLVGGYTNNVDGPADSYANRWTQLGSSVAYSGYEGRFNARAYVSLVATGGSGHRISVAKGGTPAGEVTAPFIEIRNAGKLEAVTQNYPKPSFYDKATRKLARIWQEDSKEDSKAILTSGSVTTTGPATLVAVWWGDGRFLKMTAVPDNGFKVIERFLDLPAQSGVQCAVAVKQVAVAGTYDVTWTGAPAQGAILWLFAFQSAQRPQQAG